MNPRVVLRRRALYSRFQLRWCVVYGLRVRRPRVPHWGHVILRAVSLQPSDDTPMTGRYVAVVVLEVTIVALLWLLGRAYS